MSGPSTQSAEESAASDITNAVKKITSLMEINPKGISDADLQKHLPDITPEQRVGAINKLLSQNSLELLTQGDKLIYKLLDPTKSSNLKGADNEERIVLNIIEKSSNKGIWVRDIRNECNLMLTQLNKILKNLENKKLIKAVKSVNASKKKVYMMYNVEPDSSITGGSWYNDQDFEVEFVDMLINQSYRYLENKRETAKECTDGPQTARSLARATSKDIRKFISELGVSKVELSIKDIETILNTLVCDGKVEKITALDGSFIYEAVETLLPPPGFVRSPCGVCPVFSNCNDSGAVNPKKCVYMTEWLDL